MAAMSKDFRAPPAQFTEGDFHPLDVPLSDGRIVEDQGARTPEVGWIALWSDATAARHATNRLEKAIEMSADAFAFFDRNDKLVVCNQEFAAIYGRSCEQMRGTGYPHHDRRCVGARTRRRRGGQGRLAANSPRPAQLPAGAMTLETKIGKAYLVRDRKTRGGGRVTVLTDVTDERRVEIALSQTRQALIESQGQAQKQANYLADLTRRLDVVRGEADTAKKTLLRTMSHELKTPLNAIIGFSDLLVQMADRFWSRAGTRVCRSHPCGRPQSSAPHQPDTGSDQDRRRQVRVASRAVGRGRRALAGERCVRRTRCIPEHHDRCLGLPDRPARRRRRGRIRPDDQSPDRQRHHLHPGRWGDIASRPIPGTAAISLSVSDNGPGVAPQDLDRILEPFEQAGSADHAGGGGPWPDPCQGVCPVAWRLAARLKPARLWLHRDDRTSASRLAQQMSWPARVRAMISGSRQFISNFR